MTITAIGSFTEYDTARRAMTTGQAQLLAAQAARAAAGIIAVDRLAIERAERALARARRYDAATGRTDIYL